MNDHPDGLDEYQLFYEDIGTVEFRNNLSHTEYDARTQPHFEESWLKPEDIDLLRNDALQLADDNLTTPSDESEPSG